MTYYINGEFVPKEQAMLQVNDLGLLRGYASFDFLRVIDQVPLFLNEYLDRFFRSSAMMKLKCPCSKEEIVDIVYKLILINPPGRTGIRLILSGGFAEGNYLPAAKPNFIILHEPFDTPPETIYEKGIAVKSVAYQRPLPAVKSTDYFMGIAQQLNMPEGFSDVLYHDHGWVRELPRSNIFMLTRSGQLVTPASEVLWGITRKRLLEMELTNDILVQDFTMEDMMQEAEELFLSSSTKGILSIVRVDDKVIGDGKPGKLATELRKKLIEQEQDFIRHELRGISSR